MPVGLWISRTAEEVLLMCWPPAPEERKTCISTSSGRILSLIHICSTRYCIESGLQWRGREKAGRPKGAACPPAAMGCRWVVLYLSLIHIFPQRHLSLYGASMACAAKKMRLGAFVFRYICPDFPIESNGEEVAAVAEKRERIRRRSGGQEPGEE